MGLCGSKDDAASPSAKAGGSAPKGKVPQKRAADTYDERKKLGTGASCTVYLVERKADRQQFAMKVLDKKNAANKALFQSEYEILAALKHPNIVEFVEAFEDKASWNVVTRLAGGGELFDRVLEGAFSERDASALTRQMLLALRECHRKGIVHRDLKPENVLFAEENSYDRVQLIDFGCAVRCKDDDIVLDVAGSPYYVAPEVLQPSFTRTGATWRSSDLWSIGVIVFLLVHGYPPFNGNSQNAIFTRIRRGRFRFARPSEIDLSDGLKDFVKKLLIREPSKRMTVDEALEHPWVAEAAQVPDKPLGEQVAASLKGFVSSCRLQKAVCKMLSKNLSDKDRDALAEMFDKYDTNKDGKLDADEISAMLKDIGKSTDTNEFIKILDEDDDGVVDQEEFKVVMGMLNQPDDEEKLQDLFEQFDKDKSGKLSEDEIAQLLKVTGEEARLIMAEVDTDGDNEVSFDEFLTAMTSNQGVERVMTAKKDPPHPHAVNE